MSKKILGWDESEAKAFFKYLLKNENQPLLKLFENWSNENGRQSLSVRNYFYKLCKTLKTDEKLQKKLEVSNNELKILFSKHFDLEDEKSLLCAILPIKNQKSVRKACLKLAGGNPEKMVRFQNKYRQLLKNKKSLVQQVLNELNQQGIETRQPFCEQKVVQIPSKFLSDSEVESLIKGVVNLVKTNFSDKMNLENNNQRQVLTKQLKDSFAQLKRQEVLVEELKSENHNLQNDFNALKQNLENTKSQNLSFFLEVQELVESEKMNELKTFFKNFANLNKAKKDENLV